MRTVAIGDPQASFETFLSILDRHGLIADDGRLAADVRLVSIGDHFDYGSAHNRERSGQAGLSILSWLASHSAEQVTILIGNHDLARVCELARYDDASFTQAHLEAVDLQKRGADQTDFLRRNPTLPDAECVARDYACFSEAQRVVVTELLRQRRLRLASEHSGLLLVHAGVTDADLSLLGPVPSSAAEAARALNAFLDAQLKRWVDGPLDLAPLHQAGSATGGEGRGVLYHRPCDPTHEAPERLAGPPRRRYDPRALPAAFAQVIGHIRDNKCRELMPSWCVDESGADGPLRSLTVRGDSVRYGRGCETDARLYFVDGGMAHASVEHYQLLDLDRRSPLTARPR